MNYDFRLQSIILLSVLSLGACGNSPGTTQVNETPATAQAQALEQIIEFDYNFNAFFKQEVKTSIQNDFTAKASGSSIITGTIQVENLQSSEIESHSWSVSLNDSDLSEVSSLKTLLLEPADYSFTLVLDQGNHQYVGTTAHTVIDGAADAIPMTIRPVIGDGQVTASLVSELVDFKFSYAQSDLLTAGLVDPAIGISIDSNPEQLFILNPVTGLSEPMLLNLIPGTYDINLRLFDGSVQVGKSIISQGSSVAIAPENSLIMDIIPLSGEVEVALSVSGGDAAFTVLVPHEVIDEAGGLSNLQTTLNVVGNENQLQETILTLNQINADYTASITLPELYYGDVNFELSFYDIAQNEIIGGCVESATISSAATTVDCKITLTRRSVVSGAILSAVGVTILDTNGDPVSGAVISVDGVDVAITNSANISTPGYRKLFLKPGNHTIRADLGFNYGELNYTAVPLAVDNIDLTLENNDTIGALLADDFNGNQSGDVSPVNYWFGCAAQGSHEGYFGTDSLLLGSRYNDPATDWCDATSAITDHSFTGTAVTGDNGFQVSVNIKSAQVENSVASIAIGSEIGSDSSSFDTNQEADVIVSVSDNQVEIAIIEGGQINQQYTFPNSYLMSEVTNITAHVLTSSFRLFGRGDISVTINNDQANATPPTIFTWDGGNNHIELIGSAGVAVDGTGVNYVEFDQLIVSPINLATSPF